MSICVSYMYKTYNSENIHLKETSTPIDKIIYFLKPGRALQRTEMYSSKSLSAYPKCQNHILFLHAITGCDTTSGMFRRGKHQHINY